MAITYEGAGTAAANTVANTTLNVPYPAGIAAGDVLVLVVGVSGAAPTNPTGAGFTSAITSNSGGVTPAFRVSYKIATGSESGSLAVTTVSQTSQGRMFLFRGVDQTTPIDVAGDVFGTGSAVTAYSDTTNHHPSLTTTTTGVALVYCGVSNSASGTWNPPTVPAAFTEVWDSATTTPSSTAGYLIWSGSGATGDVDLTRSAAVRGAAGVIALRPAATNISVALDTATLSLTGVDIAAAGSGTATQALDVAALTLVGVDPTAAGTGAATQALDTATLSLTGVDMTVTGGPVVVALDTAVLSLSGVDMTAGGTGATTVAADTATLTLTGRDLAAAGSGAAAVAVDSAVLTLTGVDVVANSLLADPNPITLTIRELGYTATVRSDRARQTVATTPAATTVREETTSRLTLRPSATSSTTIKENRP